MVALRGGLKGCLVFAYPWWAELQYFSVTRYLPALSKVALMEDLLCCCGTWAKRGRWHFPR